MFCSGHLVHHLPGVWVPQRADCNEGQPCVKIHFGTAELVLSCELKFLCFSWHALIFLPFLYQGEG